MEMKLQNELLNSSKDEIAVLCDFDGTITNIDSLGHIFRKFSACGMDNVRRYDRGEIDFRELIRVTFDTIEASKEEIELSLDKIEITPGFLSFLDFIRQKHYSFAIVSDGLEWYINYILNRYGIQDITVFANIILFEPHGFQFEFPWFDETTPRRGVCKSKIARAYSNQYSKIVFIGDGASDIDIVNEADLVFARGWLAGYCYAKNINHIEFNNWEDILKELRMVAL